MQTLILTIHLIVCFLLVVLILLQSGKEGMGVIFGGGNSSVFGSAGAGGILAKLTALMAVIFVITSLSYTFVTSERPETESQLLNVQIEDMPPQTNAPTAPETTAPTAPEATVPAAPEAPAPATPTAPATPAEPTVSQPAVDQPAAQPTGPANDASPPPGNKPN